MHIFALRPRLSHYSSIRVCLRLLSGLLGFLLPPLFSIGTAGGLDRLKSYYQISLIRLETVPQLLSSTRDQSVKSISEQTPFPLSSQAILSRHSPWKAAIMHFEN